MRKFLVVAIIVLSAVALNAQTINGTKISELKSDYIEIMSQAKFMSKKVTVIVDFGQQTKLFGNPNKTMLVKDENGKPVVFNSAIDALNFFSKNGYKFVSAYAVTAGNQNVYHYLMERNK